MTEPSWNELEKRQAAEPRDTRFDEACVRVFTSPDGKALLAELRRKYFEHGQNPVADDRALRVQITQQHFVRELERACERGLKATPTK